MSLELCMAASSRRRRPRMATRNADEAITKRTKMRLRDHFNAHLLAAEIMGDIFGGHGECVGAGGQVGRDGELAGTGGCSGVPAQAYRREIFEARGEGGGALRGRDAKLHGVAATDSLPVEMDVDGWRRAGDDEGLRLLIGVAGFVAQ